MKRKIELITEEYYHIYNRGTDKREIFSGEEDYFRFLKSLKEFNVSKPIGSLYEKHLREKRNLSTLGTSGVPNGHPMSTTSKLVEIICYCLNHNHYHLILKQLQEKGIEKFMQRMGNGYTKYYNQKNSRSGVLFQGPFKSAHIDTNEYFLYVSAYVNANHFIHGCEENGHPMSTENLWKYSSLSDYLGKRNGVLCDKTAILDQFKNIKEYESFVVDNALYLREKKEMEKFILE
jgi:putative transposase